MFEALDAHQSLDAALRRPPEDAALDEAAAKRAKVRAREPLAIARRHLREALLQIDARYPSALRDEPEKNRADRIADGGLNGKRQEVHEIHEPEDQPAHAATSRG